MKFHCNCLLYTSDTINGAKASALVYSIVETAKENGVNPFRYLEFLLTERMEHEEDTDYCFIAVAYTHLMINPAWLLPLTLLFCSVLSVVTGTSYGSVGSAGVAMMAIGNAMGINPGMVAGAVICGAMFGDKMCIRDSPYTI